MKICNMRSQQSHDEKKLEMSNFFLKIVQLLDDYSKCFIWGVDNVDSKHMQQVCMSLQGKPMVLMRKEMMIHKVIQGHLENNPALEKLLPHIQGNLGFVLTKQDLTEIRDMLLAILPAATCAGAIALCEVTVPSQITGLEPEKTSFFKALGFATKISKVPIEILSVCNIACICLQIPYSTAASVPHSIINGCKWVLDLSEQIDYTFPRVEKVKVILADPSAFVAASSLHQG
ncbi:60S acidic ribosomal protein P0-like [Bubalus kerabau]|uniref:60S acidic ribosomal protein P0-like n=1 Tax=Bubalus carabanensis TaxID=3119969 RepID=UPI00244EB5B9|nr:60S acidic ribosomal protein P0-like [Bubalus carabanensis]